MSATTKAPPSVFSRLLLDRYRRDVPHASARDRAIMKRVEGLIATPAWQHSFMLEVEVTDGTVRLDGTCSDGYCLDRLLDAIAALPGVVGVESEVDWVVPDGGLGRV